MNRSGRNPTSRSTRVAGSTSTRGRRTVCDDVELRRSVTASSRLAVRGDVGIAAWNSCGGGLPWGQPLDQRDDNARSIVCDWPIEERGRHARATARVALRVRTDRAYGHVSVKLCDVFPDGTSALVDTRHDRSHARRVLARRRARRRSDAHHDRSRLVSGSTWRSSSRPRPGRSGPATRCGWRSRAPTGRTAGHRPDRSRWRSTVDALGAEAPDRRRPRRTRRTTSCPGSGPSDDEADGVTWRIERDVLGRETRVMTRYGGTYPGLHGAMATDDYRGELGVSHVRSGVGMGAGDVELRDRLAGGDGAHGGDVARPVGRTPVRRRDRARRARWPRRDRRVAVGWRVTRAEAGVVRA